MVAVKTLSAPYFCLMASSSAVRRPVIPTVQPSSNSLIATSRPIPDVAPIITAFTYFAAMHSISTMAPLGRAFTAIALRAGKGAWKNWL